MNNGTCIISPSGKLIDVLNPKPEDFNIEDIAAGLITGKCERYGSRTRPRYFVAEHSVHCANLFVCWLNSGIVGGQFDPLSQYLTGPVSVAKACLLHDAAEAYLGDIVQPLKACLPDYKKIEHSFEDAIAERFGIHPGYFWHDHVKSVDQTIFRCEVRNLAYDSPEKYGIDGRKNFEVTNKAFAQLPSLRDMGWDSTRAKAEFLRIAAGLEIS